MEMKTISIINQKGGVGKTTTAATIATIWAKRGKKVLAVDMDPQGNLGLLFGVMFDLKRLTTYNVLTHTQASCSIEEAILEAKGGVDLVPATTLLDTINKESGADMLFRLRAALMDVQDDYDICVIDCPPTQGLLMQQALCASDWCLIPTNAELCSVAGIAQLSETIKEVSGPFVNPDLEVAGIVVTRLNRKSAAEMAMLESIHQVGDELRINVFPTVINDSEPITTARNSLTTVASPDAKPEWSRALGTKAYEEFAEALLMRIGD